MTASSPSGPPADQPGDLPEFDPYSQVFFDDPYDLYRRLRDESPVYCNDHYGFYALSRYDDVATASRDWRTFTSTHGITVDVLTDPTILGPTPGSTRPGEGAPGQIIFMDPPDHDRMRNLVSRVFTPKAVADLEPMIRDLIRRYLDEALERGGGTGFDAVAEFSAPFPVEVISTMLGVPEADRQQIRHWTDLMLSREAGDPKPTPAGMEAGLLLGIYIYELAREKRAHPQPDMISGLCEAGLTDEEVAGFSILLAAAGSETVTKLIGNGAVLFGRHPDQWDAVRADRELLVPAVEEVLRYWAPSQYQGRWSTAATEWHGVEIPAEQAVLLITGAANRDERAYPDPDRFDVRRPLKLNVGFGHGIHTCLGAALARLESRIAFDELADRVPAFTVDESRCRRVNMSNVAGYSNVPVTVTPQVSPA
jgi:cytochrome P450